ncbi:hypothetical protein [Streptomyces resistomycificus]|nr:hypothetical protein [Streptomyces resistomycificus]
MTGSTVVFQACGCGGTLIATPARPGAEAKTHHLDLEGIAVPCPNNR